MIHGIDKIDWTAWLLKYECISIICIHGNNCSIDVKNYFSHFTGIHVLKKEYIKENNY